NPGANLQTIDVMVSNTKEVIQTIQVPQDRVHLIYQELSEKPGEIKDKFIDSMDYNFDKFADLRLLAKWPYKVGQKYYLVWLFNEKKNQYILNEAISKLQAPQPDGKQRRIWAVDIGGFGGGEYVERAYSINHSGKLKVQTKVTQTVKDRMRFTFMRDVQI